MKKLNLTSIAMAGVLAVGGMFAASTAVQAATSYNIGVHSKYLLRGIFEENTGAAVQGGADWNIDDSGFYAGWWFSSLSYNSVNSKKAEKGVENDLYAGYAGKLSNGMGWDVGFIQYAYVNVDDSDLLEATGKLTFGDFYVGTQYLVTDGAWGNSGDIYWKVGWSTSLPQGITLALDFGYYTYNNNNNSKLSGGTTLSSSGFRHLNITASKAIGKTGADAYVQYTFAGEDRNGAEYNDSMVTGITYSF